MNDRFTPSFIYALEEGTRKIKSQYAGGILLQPVQKLVATLVFARPRKGKNANESLPAYHEKTVIVIPQSRSFQLNPPCRVEEIVFNDETPYGDEIRLDAGWVDLISSASADFICIAEFILALARISFI